MGNKLNFFKIHSLVVLALVISLPLTTILETSYIYALFVLGTFVIPTILISFFKTKIKSPSILMLVHALLSLLITVILQILVNQLSNPLFTALGIYFDLLFIVSFMLYKSLGKDYKLSTIFKTWSIYAITLLILGIIRETVGKGTITFMDLISSFTGHIVTFELFPSKYELPLAIQLSGGLILLGLILMIYNLIAERGNEV